MAEGMAVALANSTLDSILAAHPWIKAHIGSPGAAGTSNAAAETTRKQATWTSASGGSASNSVALVWTGVAGSEDWTKFSGWTAVTAGTFGHSGDITGNPVVTGDTVTIPIGGLVISFPVAS